MYSSKHPHYKNQIRRNEALKIITVDVCKSTGKQFKITDIRKKISLLRIQFLQEYKKVLNNRETGYKSSCWNYDMLSFLKNDYKNEEMPDLDTINTVSYHSVMICIV